VAKAQEMIVCLSAESISSVTIRWGLAELLLASCICVTWRSWMLESVITRQETDCGGLEAIVGAERSTEGGVRSLRC
jgi:hypothetical protein